MSCKGIYVKGSNWLQRNGKVLSVIEKIKDSAFLVKFEDSPPFKTYSPTIKNGTVKDLNDKTIYGAACYGYGDFIAKVQGKHTPEYEVWRGIIRRCYDTKSPNYRTYGGAGITLCEEWHNFQNFAKWYTELPLYGKGLHLDKDLLNMKSTQYTPSNCTLVPQNINSLFTGGFKTIVYQRRSKWVVQLQMGEKCSNGNKRQSYLGEYTDKQEALEVYFKHKIAHVIKVANQEKANLDERVYSNLTDPVWVRDYINLLASEHEDNK